MFNKLNFTEIIRYFFSGLIVTSGVMFVSGVTGQKAIEWAEQHQWAAAFSPAVAAASVVLLVGYVCFTIYRAILYDYVVVSLHACLAKRCRLFFTQKELIRKFLTENGCTVRAVEVERIYRVVRVKVAKEFYDQAAPRISAGIHLLYFSVVVAVVAVSWTGHWWWLIPVLIAIPVVVFIDLHYMREELLIFIRERYTLEKELRSLMTNPAWQCKSRSSAN